MRSTTAESYYRRLNRALDFIMRRIDRPYTVEEVAAEAAFSRFHFQRMFRAMTGESVAELGRRLRLERAAYRLRCGSASVTEVAYEACYDSVEAFSRAFRRGCGLSPSRYRTAWPPPVFVSPTARARYYPGEERVEIDPPTGEISMEVRIETFDAIEVGRMRHVGPYNEVGSCFERLFEWAAAIGARPGRVLSLSYDDPDAVAPESLRSDACVELRTDASTPPGISMDSVGAGRYAVYTHRGPYDGIAGAYKRLFTSWLPGSGEEMDDTALHGDLSQLAPRYRSRPTADGPVPAVAAGPGKVTAGGCDSAPGIPKSGDCWALRPAIACDGRIQVGAVSGIDGNDTGFAVVNTRRTAFATHT